MKFNYAFLRECARFFTLGLIIAGVIGAVNVAGCCILSIGYLRLVCPVGFLELCLSDHRIFTALLPAFLSVVFILFIGGKFFCAWFCPASFIGEKFVGIIKKIFPGRWCKKFRHRTKKIQKYIPQPGYRDALALTLGAFIGIWIFRYPFLSIVCPLGVISRNIIELLTHFRLRYDLFLLIIPGLAAIIWIRGWKNLCPIGAVRGMVSTFNFIMVPVVDTDLCIHCKKCEKQCPEGLSPYLGMPDLGLCHKCFKCIDNCPEKALRVAAFDSPHCPGGNSGEKIKSVHGG